VEGFIARLTPYQKEVEPGENFTYQCEVANPTPSSQKIAVRLVVPENWAAEPGICETELSPGQVAMLDSMYTYRQMPIRSGANASQWIFSLENTTSVSRQKHLSR